MPQQRIHEVTKRRLEKLEKSINEQRVSCGLKKMTVPDIIENIVELHEVERNKVMKKKKNAASKKNQITEITR